MNIGMWSSYFINLSPEDMVETFAKKGWFNLELSTEHSQQLVDRGDPSSVGRVFREFAASRGVFFPQGHLLLHVDVTVENWAEIVETLKRWLDLYFAIGIHSAVIHPGGKALKEAGAAPEAIMERRVRGFRPLAEHAEGTELSLCLENTPWTATAEEIVGIIEAVGRRHMGICLDTGHANMTKTDQAAFIRASGPLLKALHIADNEGQTDQHLMPFGKGNVPWKTVVSALKEIGFDGLFNLEIPGENRCPLAVRLAKLDYLRDVIPLLINEMGNETPVSQV